ncbi:Putative mitochondrial ribosomal protein l30 [Gryllus bimaculatus]|nr:Putative mitochondrial ribosomal protein l30 [Gryllus bimaculatus]
MISQVLKNLINPRECCSLQRHYSSAKKAVKCPGFTYFRRFPEEEDPPLEKSKLFMVQRVKRYRGTPYWEKDVLLQLGLMDKASDIAIVKNTPQNNALLWKIKHLIKITPITYPYGEPTEKDIGATYLKENGELLRSKLVEIDNTLLEASETFANDVSRMDTKTLRKQLRYQWLNPLLNGIN